MPDLIITGFERALLGFRDSNGIFCGQAATLSNGSTSGAYVAALVRTASFQAIAVTNLDIQGGDRVFTTIQFGNTKTAPFQLIMSNYDTSAVTMISGSSANTTNSSATVVSENPNKTSARVLMLGLQSRAQTTDGTQKYVTRFFPACQMRIKRNGPGYQALADTVVEVTPQMVSKNVFGQSFGSSGLNMNLENDLTDNYDYISDNPIHLVAFKQDASTTTFNTIYKPLATTVTNNATPNQFYIGGVATALSSLTLPGVGTLAAAGTGAVQDVLVHETGYVGV